MKILLLILVLTTVGFCQEYNSTNFYDQKNEDTDYDTICNDQNITINFSDLNLNSIGYHFLSSPIINCLDLSSNGIQSVAYNAFQNLPNLKYLNLAHNSFNLIDIFSHGHLNLETLILDDNAGYGLREKRVQTEYPKLKKLFLRNQRENLNNFAAKSKTIFPSLTHLYLSGVSISDDNFSWLPDTLEYLDLSDHSLQSLTLKDLKNLKWIYLDQPEKQHYLTEIHFHNLISLKYLSLSSNRINEITHNTFVNIDSLLFLDISDNNIKNVDGGSFDSMKNLQILNLSKNNIDFIQAGIFDKLHNLETLVLDNNLISMFPMILNDIKLKRLFLNCNKLKSIIGGTFTQLPHLETLYLHSNEITYIDQQAFAGLISLKTLTLSDNHLQHLQNNWLLPMIKLEKLDLSSNNIVEFGNLSLSDSIPLQDLYLSNRLEIIRSISLLENVSENVTIHLNADNSFVPKCDKNNNKYNPRYYGY